MIFSTFILWVFVAAFAVGGWRSASSRAEQLRRKLANAERYWIRLHVEKQALIRERDMLLRDVERLQS